MPCSSILCPAGSIDSNVSSGSKFGQHPNLLTRLLSRRCFHLKSLANAILPLLQKASPLSSGGKPATPAALHSRGKQSKARDRSRLKEGSPEGGNQVLPLPEPVVTIWLAADMADFEAALLKETHMPRIPTQMVR